ncbi:hypothetical protein, partial [Nocardiopsis sp. MG754419]|uniref:hypothetical protein n=1 Tax=Nocardiopsis sp. MG754419 TaxID=2259865 RepID=UPI001BA66982
MTRAQRTQGSQRQGRRRELPRRTSAVRSGQAAEAVAPQAPPAGDGPGAVPLERVLHALEEMEEREEDGPGEVPWPRREG